MIVEAWAALGVQARDYRPMTSGGVPTDRVKRTLFTRIFDREIKAELQRAEVSHVIADEAARQLIAVSDRLDRTARWHKALRDAYYLLPKDERFLPDAVEGLFVPAWEESDSPNAPDEESAQEVIARLTLRTGNFSVFQIDRLLADPGVREDLERILDQAWDGAAEHEELGGADARDVQRQLAAFCADLVPVRDHFSTEVIEAWTRLSQDPRLPRSIGPRGIQLTLGASPAQPALDRAEDSAADEAHWSLAASAYRPLDDTLRGRLGKVLRKPPHPFDLTPTAWDGLERAARVSAQTFGLGSDAARSALTIGAFAYLGVTVDRRGNSGKLPPGAIAYLATCWRNAGAVSAQVARNGAVAFSDAQDFIENPHEYLVGRLWVRLSRTDYDGHMVATPAELWWHVVKALQSSANHVSELGMRIAREGMGFVSTDNLEHAGEEIQEEHDLRAGLSGEPRGSMSVVLRFGAARAGVQRVEAVVAAMTGRGVDATLEAEPADVWESWVLGVAALRAARRESEEGPFDASQARAVRTEEIGKLPTYAQAREQVRARRKSRQDRAQGVVEKPRGTETREEAS
ncbi:hypothetical protein AB2L57_09620 [Microbacterium sp. HA-8]|uniref:hypothetical protein n=1 Tax=Microbacterium sp. HA-8 TaxID=3234200 RepID=UPI0038F65D2A